MLLSEIPLGDVKRYLASTRWALEQKHDGTRGMAHLTARGLRMLGRDGEPLKHTAATQWVPGIKTGLSAWIDNLDKDDLVILDGEVIIGTGEYRVFDMPMMRVAGSVEVGPTDPQRKRRLALDAMAAKWFTHPLSTVRRVTGPAEKQRMYDECFQAGVEGVVFKHIEGKYIPGLRSDMALKAKFVKSADLVIIGRRRSPNSATLGAFNDRGRMVPVGNVSMIGKPGKLGDVVEVSFLYWTGTNLYQPRIMQVRHDKEASECRTSQFTVYTRETV